MQRTKLFEIPVPPPRQPYSLQVQYVKYGLSVIRPSAVLCLKYGRGCKTGGRSVQRR